MKKISVTAVLSLPTVLAATPALADEPIDCFYEANRMQAVCQAAPEMIVMHGAAE